MERTSFAEYVILRRKALGKSQRSLAEVLNYSPQAISRFESVDSSFPLDLLPTLCQFLDCSLDDIFRRREFGTSYEEPNLLKDEALGLRMAEIRIEAGKSQDDIAELCGISVRSIHNYERGKAAPSYQTLERWARCCGKNIAAFDAANAPLYVTKRRHAIPRPVLVSIIAVLVASAVAIPTGIVLSKKSSDQRHGYSFTSSDTTSNPVQSDSSEDSKEESSAKEAEIYRPNFAAPKQNAARVSSSDFIVKTAFTR